MLNVNIAGGASISLTYIASERIIPGYSHAFLLLLEVTMPFFFPFKNIIINCHMQIWWRHEFSKGCSRE